MTNHKGSMGTLASLRPPARPSLLPNLKFSPAEIKEMLFRKYNIEDDVLVIQKGLWYAAYVVDLGTDKFPEDPTVRVPVAKVHYPGWYKSYDEWVMGDSMMICSEENEATANAENAIIMGMRKEEKLAEKAAKVAKAGPSGQGKGAMIIKAERSPSVVEASAAAKTSTKGRRNPPQRKVIIKKEPGLKAPAGRKSRAVGKPAKSSAAKSRSRAGAKKKAPAASLKPPKSEFQQVPIPAGHSRSVQGPSNAANLQSGMSDAARGISANIASMNAAPITLPAGFHDILNQIQAACRTIQTAGEALNHLLEGRI